MCRYFYLLFLVLLTEGLAAQVPGFMGKRHIVSVNGYGSISEGAAVSSHSRTGGFNFNKKFSLAYDYVNSLRWTLGVEFQHISSGTELSIDENLPDKRHSLYGISANAISINFTRVGSRSDFIAPVGRYFNFGLQYIAYRVTDDNAVLTPKNTVLKKGNIFGLFCSVGRKRIINKTIVFDIAGQVLIPLNRTDDIAAIRIREAWVIGLKLGVGYLL